MKKAFTVICLLLALCLAVSGCAKDPDPTTENNLRPPVPVVTDPTDPSETEPPVVIQCQYLPEVVENPDNLPVVKWVCLTDYTPDTKYDEAMAVQFNQLLAQKEMPFRVQFAVYTSENRKGDWFQQPEVREDLETADLIYGYIDREKGLSFVQPMTDAVETYSLQNAVPHEAYWLQTTLDGEIYGVRSKAQYLVSNGWWVDDQVLKNCGLTAEDFQKPYWEMDRVFSAIYEQKKETPFLKYVEDGYTHGNLLQNYEPEALGSVLSNHFQLVGSCYAIDFSGETPAVVNYLDTDYTRNTQAAMLRYRQAGYMASGTQPWSLHYSNVFVDFPYTYEGMSYISTEPAQIGNTDFGGYMTGLSKNAPNRDAALSLLSLLANDSDVRDQLLFGTPEETAEGTRFLSFLSPYSSLRETAGTSFEFPAAPGQTKLESHREILDRSILQLPVTFDFSAVAAETAGVNAVLTEYFNRFSQLTEPEYTQMLSEIQAAGGDRIQAELQRQLDAWLAANPDWGK